MNRYLEKIALRLDKANGSAMPYVNTFLRRTEGLRAKANSKTINKVRDSLSTDGGLTRKSNMEFKVINRAFDAHKKLKNK